MGAWRPAKWKFFADEYGFRMCSPFRLGSRGERRSSQEICFPNPTAKTSQLGPVLCDGRNSSEKEREVVFGQKIQKKKYFKKRARQAFPHPAFEKSTGGTTNYRLLEMSLYIARNMLQTWAFSCRFGIDENGLSEFQHLMILVVLVIGDK